MLPGCMSQGKSEEEALQNIKEAINGYLKTLKKHRKTVATETCHFVSVGV